MKYEQKWVAILAALCLSPLAALADVPTYTIIELARLPEMTGVVPQGMNQQGQIVGVCWWLDSEQHAVAWIDGVVHDLGPGQAAAINASGTVVGSNGYQLFLWDAVTGRRTLPLPYDEVWAGGINDLGQIAGTVRNYEPAEAWAFLYDGVSLKTLAPAGAEESACGGLNSSGHVAGHWWGANGAGGAFLFREGTTIDLGVFPGWEYLTVTGLNDHDVLIGTVYGNEPEWHYRAYKFDFPNGQWVELPSASEANVSGINNFGQVVGGELMVGAGAALWDADGSLHRLNDLISPQLGWELSTATAINDAGMICGFGLLRGDERAYVLIPGNCPGDIIADGLIDLQDLAAFLSAFGICTGEPNFTPLADINSNGCIELDDLGQFLALFGTSCR